MGDQYALSLIRWVSEMGHQQVARRFDEVFASGSPTQKKRLADAFVLEEFNMDDASTDQGIQFFLGILDRRLASSPDLSVEWLEGALEAVIAVNKDTGLFPETRPAFIEKILWALLPESLALEIFEKMHAES